MFRCENHQRFPPGPFRLVAADLWAKPPATERHAVAVVPVIEPQSAMERCGEYPLSMDWFKGESTGNHGFYHQI